MGFAQSFHVQPDYSVEVVLRCVVVGVVTIAKIPIFHFSKLRIASKEPYDCRASFRLFSPSPQFICSSPSKHFGTNNWPLLCYTRTQGIFLDLHGPPNEPQNETCQAEFRDPW